MSLSKTYKITSSFEDLLYTNINENKKYKKHYDAIDRICRSLRDFKVLICDIHFELDTVPNEILLPFIDHIFEYVKIQKCNPNLLREIKNYFADRKLINSDVISQSLSESLFLSESSDKIKQFNAFTNSILKKYAMLFNTTDLETDLLKYNIYEKFITTLNNRDLSELIKIAYNYSLITVFLFLFVFYRVPFNFSLLAQSTINTATICNTAQTNTVSSTSGSATTCNIVTACTHEEMQLRQSILYLKSVSKMIKLGIYIFNQKYYDMVAEHFGFSVKLSDII